MKYGFVQKLSEELSKETFIQLMVYIRAWEQGCTDKSLHSSLEKKFGEFYPDAKEVFDVCEKNGFGYPV